MAVVVEKLRGGALRGEMAWSLVLGRFAAKVDARARTGDDLRSGGCLWSDVGGRCGGVVLKKRAKRTTSTELASIKSQTATFRNPRGDCPGRSYHELSCSGLATRATST